MPLLSEDDAAAGRPASPATPEAQAEASTGQTAVSSHQTPRPSISERLRASLRAFWPGLSVFQLAIVLIAGYAHAASTAWPFDSFFEAGQPLWWLQPLSLAFLVWQLEKSASVRQAAFLGWLFATAMMCGTWWWLFISMHTYGGLAAPLAVLAVVGLAGFLALYFSAVCALFRAVVQVSRACSAIVFASLWLLAELARVQIFTGFPWGEGGYAQLDGPFAGLASVVGVHGLTWGLALLAAAVAAALRRPGWLTLGSVFAGLLLGLAGGFALQARQESTSAFTHDYPAAKPEQPFTVTLLQGNIAQDEKFQGGSGIPDALKWYGEQLRDARTSLIVTPETAIPLLPVQLPDGYLDGLVNRFLDPPANRPPVAALIGIPLGNSQKGYTNSVIGLQPVPLDAAGKRSNDPNDGVYRYDKHHLVPFGEFVHPLFKWFLDVVEIPLSDFNRGAVSQPSFDWAGQRIAPNICYEDLFGEELAERFADPATAPTMFVNVSNIAWFGDSVAIDQHLAISRMRAIEFERPMLRATNTGATVVIDHRGLVTHALPRHTRGALVAVVQGRSGITPYAWWVSRFGLWPLWLLAMLVPGLVLGWAKVREKRTASA